MKEDFYKFCDESNDVLQTLSKRGTDKISDWWLVRFKKTIDRMATYTQPNGGMEFVNKRNLKKELN